MAEPLLQKSQRVEEEEERSTSFSSSSSSSSSPLESYHPSHVSAHSILPQATSPSSIKPQRPREEGEGREEERTEGRDRSVNGEQSGGISSSTGGTMVSPGYLPPLVLRPVSMTPVIALNPQVESVDLYANTKALDQGQGCCSYLCTRSPPPFDWVPFLHAAALHRPSSSSPPPPVPSSSRFFSPATTTTSPSPSSTLDTSHTSHPSASSSTSTSTQTRVDVSSASSSLPLYYMMNDSLIGYPPVGHPASLLTMFGKSQVIFRGVREINRAHSFFWQICFLFLISLVLFLPGIGILIVLLIGCCSSFRKLLDDGSLQRMRSACETVNQQLSPCGVGFLLLEGYGSYPSTTSHDAPPTAQVNSLGGDNHSSSSSVSTPYRVGVDSSSSSSGGGESIKRVWVIRIYMLPRTDGVYSPGATAAAQASSSSLLQREGRGRREEEGGRGSDLKEKEERWRQDGQGGEAKEEGPMGPKEKGEKDVTIVTNGDVLQQKKKKESEGKVDEEGEKKGVSNEEMRERKDSSSSPRRDGATEKGEVEEKREKEEVKEEKIKLLGKEGRGGGGEENQSMNGEKKKDGKVEAKTMKKKRGKDDVKGGKKEKNNLKEPLLNKENGDGDQV
ncbi:transmembrane protein [Cystoisospora suis]|uniref:Transmembrane protein n=1 Tax=Cystoisospora suis TaxID=483139 RepID=A0A2C6LD98_9APIC|nr:transmembrane protein [Cystoisospora suis]